MRWPLRSQLLLPVLAVVIVAILGSSVSSAYLAAEWARERQEESLARVVATLTDASFPLTESVLKKMSGLSGADFVVFDSSGIVQDSSRRLADADLQALRQLPSQQNLADFANGRLLDLAGGRFLASRLPVVSRSDRDTSTTLVVLYPEERWTIARRQVIYPPLVVGAAAVLLAVAVTAIFARRVVRPLESLRRQAAAIEQGEFRPLPLGSRNDEIQDLTRSINHMVERLARYEADVRLNERLRTLGQLGAGVAHQMRNAATGARLALDLHRQECPLDPGCETLEVAKRQFTLMETYLQRFLTFGRGETLSRVPLDLGQLIDSVLPLVRPACQHARIELRFDRPDKSALVLADSKAIEQLLVNLLTNAIEAAAGAFAEQKNGSVGAVEIELARDTTGRIECRIGDTGPGPAATIGERLFEPFVSDKPDGTGLGLAVAHQIAADHQAELRWHRANGMTWFIIAFAETNTLARGANEESREETGILR
jgi:signal transduction histidine kinase